MLRRHQGGPLRSLAVYLRFAYGLAVLVPSLFGAFPRTCNICGKRGRLLAFGLPPRLDARCPRCGSMERHRLQALWIAQNKDEFRDRKVVHFAPEFPISKILRPLSSGYVAADLDARRADMVLDLEDISLDANSVDVIVCNHVLEHVDDRLALREFHRVLRPGGLVLLMFPIVEGWDRTYENESVKTARERTLHFGQYDHVRYYGRDVRARIINAGFELTEFTAEEPDVSQYGLVRGEKLFIARKPAN